MAWWNLLILLGINFYGPRLNVMDNFEFAFTKNVMATKEKMLVTIYNLILLNLSSDFKDINVLQFEIIAENILNSNSYEAKVYYYYYY